MGVVSVQQRLGNVEGVEGKSVAVTTFTDIHQEMDKVLLTGFSPSCVTVVNIVHRRLS